MQRNRSNRRGRRADHQIDITRLNDIVHVNIVECQRVMWAGLQPAKVDRHLRM